MRKGLPLSSAIISLLILIICFPIITSVYAQSFQFGVSNGDEFYYTLNSYWTSFQQDTDSQHYLEAYNQTEYVKVTVKQVVPPTVTFKTDEPITSDWDWIINDEVSRTDQIITYSTYPTIFFDIEQQFKNGTVSNVTAFVFYKEWTYYNSSLLENFCVNFIIPSDLEIGTNLRQFGSITKTLPIAYQDSERNTCYIEGKYEEQPIAQCYFDRATGVLVKEVVEVNLTTGNYSIALQLRDTNLWKVSALSNTQNNILAQPSPSIPELVSPIIITSIIITTLTCILILRRKAK